MQWYFHGYNSYMNSNCTTKYFISVRPWVLILAHGTLQPGDVTLAHACHVEPCGVKTDFWGSQREQGARVSHAAINASAPLPRHSTWLTPLCLPQPGEKPHGMALLPTTTKKLGTAPVTMLPFLVISLPFDMHFSHCSSLPFFLCSGST